MTETKTKCEGSGKPGENIPGTIYACCPDCKREFSAQGRKARVRIGNPWQAIPRHYR